MEIIERCDLPNGLTVEFLDASRKVAGDRWYVGLVTRIPVPVSRDDLLALPEGPKLADEFLEKTGGIITFELKKERNFIDEREKDRIFEGIHSRLKAHVLDYLAHESFAVGVIRREFEEFRERRQWWREQKT